MNNNELYSLTEPLSTILDGKGVFLLSLIIAVVFGVIYRSNKSRHLLNSLPGLCTSLGLLGTFVAICNSLGNISEDSLEVDKIINNLVPAFTSSIAGLISAFVATIFIKLLYSFEDKKIDQKLSNLTPDELLFYLHEESKKTNYLLNHQLKQHSDQMQKDDVNIKEILLLLNNQSNTLGVFIKEFVASMDDVFENMQLRVENTFKVLGSSQFNEMSNFLNELTNKLSLISVDLLEEQRNNVKKVVEKSSTEIGVVTSTFTTQLELLSQNLSVALSNLENNQEKHYSSIIGMYNTLSTQQVIKNAETASSFENTMNDVYDRLVTNLSENLDRFIGATIDGVSESVNTLKMSYEYINDHVAHIKGNYESSAQSFEDAVIHASRMNESQEKILLTINNRMEDVIMTNNRVGEVFDYLNCHQERIEDLIVRIDNIGKAISVLQSLEAQLNRIANR